MRKYLDLEMRVFVLWSRVALFVGGWDPASLCGDNGPLGSVDPSPTSAAFLTGAACVAGTEEHFGGRPFG